MKKRSEISAVSCGAIYKPRNIEIKCKIINNKV